MDKTKKSKIPQCGRSPDLSQRKVVVGSKQLRKALEKGTAECVFLAENADPAITEPIEGMCRKLHIQITWVPTMAELGRKCGIEVGAAAAAVLNS